MADCGGCQGLGAHSRRCPTQPGWHWCKLADEAEHLGDMIGSNDPGLANMAYTIEAGMRARWRAAQERALR